MPELKKFWIVTDYVGNDPNELFTDRAILNDEHRLAQLCGALPEGGYSIHTVVRIYLGGGGQDTWEQEKTKVYDNDTDAREDAEKRLAAYRAKFEKTLPSS